MESSAQLSKKLHHLKFLQREMRERQRERQLEFYQPGPTQGKFHASKADIRLLEGGNRSGKSTAGITEDIAHAIGYRPWDGSKTCRTPSKGIIYAPDFESSHNRTTIPKLHHYIPPNELSHIIKGQRQIEKEFHFKNGSVIFLGSYDQKLVKAESSDWDWIHWDEPPPRPLWIAASRGLVDREGREWFTMTPLTEPWIFDELHSKAGHDNIELDFDEEN